MAYDTVIVSEEGLEEILTIIMFNPGIRASSVSEILVKSRNWVYKGIAELEKRKCIRRDVIEYSKDNGAIGKALGYYHKKDLLNHNKNASAHANKNKTQKGCQA
jgi:hypothetical protein